MTPFETWSAFLDEREGDFSRDPTDPGNWTGGKPGMGVLRGTKFGISAAAHPTLEIEHLTHEQAVAMRRAEYWDRVSGDMLPPAVAFAVADAAYMSGPITARRQLQQVLGVEQDGIFGPETFQALKNKTGTPEAIEQLLVEFHSVRLLYEASLANWKDARGGWSRRLFAGLLEATSLT